MKEADKALKVGWWSGWVWEGEGLTTVVPDKGP